MKSELFADTEKTASLGGPDLLRQCAKNLQNTELWEEFYSRYRRRILLYLLRAFRKWGGHHDEFVRYADDWVQELFAKLVQNNGRVISSFRGTTDVSVYAFLCSIALSIVADQLRAQNAVRRRAQVLPMEQLKEESRPNLGVDARFSALLELIDVENALLADEESKNPRRDLLIFKLRFVEGLSTTEIASIAALKLTTSGVEKVLNRVRNRLVRQ